MHHLTSLRNICAHHSRLWNRKFTITLKLPKTPQNLVRNFNQSEPRRLYNSLVILIWLLKIVNPKSSWEKQLVALLNSCPNNLRQMGFPDDYQTYLIWTVY